ncbi:hypothetical protein [Marinilabilia rubra]|uniref:Uncharacterized protein n=1 Tax=Marinilabilia rubra TaxID=2162893 RepID=A0A2U2B3K7_9BACT|nr:hypothetical protein [Marinilabilia rubra]PWD97651.1 hypothetical protein DDZ16_19650 [Marinilabilia rubra]
MKKLRFFTLMVATLIMGLSFTACEEDGSLLEVIDDENDDTDGDDDTDSTPAISIEEGDNTATETVYVSDLASDAEVVEVEVTFSSTDDKMRRLYMTQNIAGAGAEKFELEMEGLDKKGDGSLDLSSDNGNGFTYKIPFPVLSEVEDGTVEYKIWATSGRGDYRDAEKRLVAGPGTITVDYGGDNPATVDVKEYTAVLLAAPLADGSSETFISLLDGEVYALSNEEYTSYWDFGYYYLNNDGPSLASTASYPALFDHDNDESTDLVAISGLTGTAQEELNSCYFTPSSIDFDAVQSSSDLDGITKSADEAANNLEVGDVIEFVDNYGKKGVIKVSDVTTGYTGSITLDIKVQP